MGKGLRHKKRASLAEKMNCPLYLYPTEQITLFLLDSCPTDRNISTTHHFSAWYALTICPLIWSYLETPGFQRKVYPNRRSNGGMFTFTTTRILVVVQLKDFHSQESLVMYGNRNKNPKDFLGNSQQNHAVI